MRDKRLHEVDEDLYFSIDEQSNVIDLTEKEGLHYLPKILKCLLFPTWVKC